MQFICNRFFSCSFYFIALIFCLHFNCSANFFSTTNNKPPRYADVWGYDVSDFPACHAGLMNIDAYMTDDNDIWFIVTHTNSKPNPMNPSAPKPEPQYMLIKFFRGTQEMIDKKQRDEIDQQYQEKKIAKDYLLNNGIHFKYRSRLNLHAQDCPKSEFVPDFYRNYFIKTNRLGRKTKWLILGASPQTRMYADQAEIDNQKAAFFYQKLSLMSDVVPLKDDTFIAYSSDCGLILRFDKYLKTKFKPVTPIDIFGIYTNRNFFVVNYDLIEKFYNKALIEPLPLYQSVHDSLLEYLNKRYGS